MLKIPKGLKKKKKGKKSKRKGEEELFTEEELEKYRREHQAQAQTQVQTQQVEAQYDSDQEPTEKPKPDNDEWSKFNALTTGIDTVLKKTQGDLDRIKSTSFFQRIPSGPKLVDRAGKDLPLKRDATKEGQRWIGFEEGHSNGNQEESSSDQAVKQEETPQVATEFPLSETESEEEDDFDDIFDTSYVEAVEKGEVKLAYIPDSPDEVVDEGPDPFDTSYAEKVIKGPEVSKKGKKLVNIGVAVEVLTGRLDNVTPSAAAVKKAKRRIPRDLLFENADSDEIDVDVEEPANPISLLDDGPGVLEDVPVDLSVSLHTQFIKKTSGEPSNDLEDKQNDILSTFDTLKADDDDDEFAQIASESLNKPLSTDNPIIPVQPVEPVLDDLSWAAFEEPKSNKPGRPPPPLRPASGPHINKVESDISPSLDQNSPIEFDDGPDPFDTTFAENILPGKAEIRSLEEEFLTNDSKSNIPNSDSDFDFNPREGERPFINNRRQSSVHIHITDPAGIRESISDFDNGDIGDFDSLKPLHRDLLGGSSTDLSQLADSPIAPTQDQSEIDYSDPFDTSIANNITAPGKTELKFIENELLGETELKKSLSDPDFDPRAEEEAETYKSAPRKPSRPENLLVNKTVIFKIPTEETDSLDVDKSNKKKPVTPYYAREASITDEEVNTLEDTFETSSNSLGAAKPILKNIQAVPIQLTRSTSDQDLNTEEEEIYEKSFSQLRRHSDFPINFSKNFDVASLEKKAQTKRTDFLSITEEESVDTKVLTPCQDRKDSFDIESDPFDTSIVGNVLRPGKTELKVLESELLAKDITDDFDPRKDEKSKQVQDLLEPSDDVFQVKALTPQLPEAATGFLLNTEEDIDPFDTSFADNLGPGKTELKILESELMN